MIRDKFPSAAVCGDAGRRNSFEVSIEGVLLFSMLEQGSFPNFDDVLEVIRAIVGGENPGKLTHKISRL